MKYIICSECQTQNEPQYKYCKNCGKQLVEENDNKANNDTYTHYDKRNASKVMVDSIGPVPIDDVEIYVGKKSYDILPKFSKMEITDSKTSWCWPSALLGYFFGPLGAAVWFFYRKMYKIALILVAIGLVITAGLSFISGDVAAVEEGLTTQIESGNFDIESIFEIFSDAQTQRVMVADYISGAFDLLTMVLCGLFSYHFYKQDAINKILKYKSKPVDSRYYRMGLTAIGGTSSGMAILGIVVMSFIQELCTIIAALVL